MRAALSATPAAREQLASSRAGWRWSTGRPSRSTSRLRDCGRIASIVGEKHVERGCQQTRKGHRVLSMPSIHTRSAKQNPSATGPKKDTCGERFAMGPARLNDGHRHTTTHSFICLALGTRDEALHAALVGLTDVSISVSQRGKPCPLLPSPCPRPPTGSTAALAHPPVLAAACSQRVHRDSAACASPQAQRTWHPPPFMPLAPIPHWQSASPTAWGCPLVAGTCPRVRTQDRGQKLAARNCRDPAGGGGTSPTPPEEHTSVARGGGHPPLCGVSFGATGRRRNGARPHGPGTGGGGGGSGNRC